MSQVIRKIDKCKKVSYLGVSEIGKAYLERIGYYNVYPQYRQYDLEFGSEPSDGRISFYLFGYHLFTVYVNTLVEVNRDVVPRWNVYPNFDIETKVRLNELVRDLFYDKESNKTVVGLLNGVITSWVATETSVRFQNCAGDSVVYTW